jgi:hypothetical protein
MHARALPPLDARREPARLKHHALARVFAILRELQGWEQTELFFEKLC